MKKIVFVALISLSLFAGKQKLGVGLVYQNIPTCNNYHSGYYNNLGIALRYKKFDSSFSQSLAQVAYIFAKTKGRASMSVSAGIRSGYDFSAITVVAPIGLELKVIKGLKLFLDYDIGYRLTSSSSSNGFVNYVDAGFRYYF
jgi:hypothetical protein